MARKRTKKARSAQEQKLREKSDKHVRTIVVLFTDIVGCSEISNRMTLEKYNNLLDRFHSLFEEVCQYYKELEQCGDDEIRWDCRGDEGCLKIFPDPTKSGRTGDPVARSIDKAINLALDLKRMWLFVDQNAERIDQNLLPIELAIGIHVGKAWLNEEEEIKIKRCKYRPEGYAINLAKRIETASRDGMFTHVLLSEAARGKLHYSQDEPTYWFATPFPVPTKGISQKISAFEVKHHYLPTDWTVYAEEISMIYNELDDKKVDFAKRAWETNPINLWLAEEYLALTLMYRYKKLPQEDREDVKALERAYKDVFEEAQNITNVHGRDPGMLAICAFIAGEMGWYQQEQKMYRDALEADKKNGELWWYLGYSMSYEFFVQHGKDLDTNYDDLDEQNRKRVESILCTYGKAIEYSPSNAWILEDYGAELARWAHSKEADSPSKEEKEHRKQSVEVLTKAFYMNSDTIEEARDDVYIDRVRDDKKIQNFLEE